ncbi:MAG TPA: hypothetical protein VNK95_13790 [Caldilineaceae bacterium]|nr:hypothetical protein [Caldilineaceae bacterium]
MALTDIITGGLAKLQILPLESGNNPSLGSGFEVQFNPETISFSKGNEYTHKTEIGGDVPKVLFSGGKAGSITLDLIFDSTDTGNDVRERYKTLLELARTQPPPDQDKNSQPAHVKLIWGNFYDGSPDKSYIAVIEEITQSFSFFKEDGTPLRANVSVTLREAKDPNDREGTNPTSRSEVRRTWVVERGQRLDYIAFRAYGSTAAWRHIAESNHILDPLSIRPGQILKLPPLG